MSQRRVPKPPRGRAYAGALFWVACACVPINVLLLLIDGNADHLITAGVCAFAAVIYYSLAPPDDDAS